MEESLPLSKETINIVAQTEMFYAIYSDNPPATSKHVTIYFGKSSHEHFGHAWILDKSWGGEHAGKWTFNRGDVPIKMDYTPEEYYHDTLEKMLEYFEKDYWDFLTLHFTER